MHLFTLTRALVCPLKHARIFLAMTMLPLAASFTAGADAGAGNNTVAAADAGATNTALPPKKQTAGRDRLGAFAPQFAELNDDVLFGQVWSRERELPPRDRSVVTIVSLIAGGNFEQLPFHLKKGKDNGITKTEIVEIITHQAFYSGWPKAWSAFNLAKEIYAGADSAKHAGLEHSTIFPLGEPVNPAWFAGKAWLKMISTENAFNTPVANVTFAPGARNHWHSHKVGQILLVTGGEGFYQEWGGKAQLLKEGGVVNIPPGVKHWHGATKDSWFAHLAINSGETEWFEPVTDAQYESAENEQSKNERNK